jgi:hypothetical protein
MNENRIMLIVFWFLLFCAIYWEYCDFTRMGKMPSAMDPTLTPKQQKERLVYYSCFNYDNGIQWKYIYIQCTICLFLILYVLKKFGIKLEFHTIVLIFACIFFTFYGGATFKNFHFQRVLASKCRKDLVIF